MTSQELNELTTALEKKLSERYDDLLIEHGKWQQLFHDEKDRADLLWRSVQQLTTSNKKLTNKLARAKDSLEYYQKTTTLQHNVIVRAREISPEVCTRINEILNEEHALSQTNK